MKTICYGFLKYPRQESNLYLKFRKLLFYPLNYEGGLFELEDKDYNTNFCYSIINQKIYLNIKKVSSCFKRIDQAVLIKYTQTLYNTL